MATLEGHIKKLEAEYERMNDEMAKGETDGYDAASGSYLLLEVSLVLVSSLSFSLDPFRDPSPKLCTIVWSLLEAVPA